MCNFEYNQMDYMISSSDRWWALNLTVAFIYYYLIYFLYHELVPILCFCFFWISELLTKWYCMHGFFLSITSVSEYQFPMLKDSSLFLIVLMDLNAAKEPELYTALQEPKQTAERSPNHDGQARYEDAVVGWETACSWVSEVFFVCLPIASSPLVIHERWSSL